PRNRRLFLTAGADGTGKLFSALEAPRPLLLLEPAAGAAAIASAASCPAAAAAAASQGMPAAVTAAAWSPTRPLVFALATADGVIYLYDLGQSTTVPVSALGADGGGGGSGGGDGRGDGSHERARAPGMLSVAFNPMQRDFLAAGDAYGRVHVWQLSWGLANARPGEELALEQM
ncbi:unnamed protein product, partial [Phaeothamnion confervicola]